MYVTTGSGSSGKCGGGGKRGEGGVPQTPGNFSNDHGDGDGDGNENVKK